MKPPIQPGPQPDPTPYRFQLLRLRPVPASDEFYNLAVVLLSADGRVLDARFSPDLSRLRCHPAVEMPFVEALREEFEERLLAGEGFADYYLELRSQLSGSLDVSDERALEAIDPVVEIERLVAAYIAPRGLAEGDAADSPGAPGSRLFVRKRLEQALADQRLFLNGHGVQRGVRRAYGPGRLAQTFDFGYLPADSSGERLLHALGARDEANEATRLCFVFEKLRAGLGGLTIVAHDGLADETRDLLESSAIEPVLVSHAGALAERVRRDLGL